MSPLVWDLAHIGHFEELWLLRRIKGAAPIYPTSDDVYDAFEHSREERPSLALLDPATGRAYLAEVRARVLDVLAGIDLDPSDRLLDGGFVFGLVVQHEQQHVETMLQTLQLSGLVHEGGGPAATGPGQEVLVAGGCTSRRRPPVGIRQRAARPRGRARRRFGSARRPVTNGEYAAFLADGGRVRTRRSAGARRR